MTDNLFNQILRNAQNTGTAIAAVNILNHITTRAVIRAAENASRPVIIQPSVGTVKRYGVTAFADMVDSVRNEANVLVALHLDHCKDETLVKECVKAGWDSVMVDFSDLTFDENVLRTRRIVEFAHYYGVAVEGEIGIISGVEDDISHDTSILASFEETMEYVEKTGIDAVAPAIGTAHGVYTGRPVINFNLVEQLGNHNIPVVVHGGTGLLVEDFSKLIRLGTAKVNISTALKHIYLNTAKNLLMDEKIAPIPFDQAVEDACTDEIERFIRLFAGENVSLNII